MNNRHPSVENVSKFFESDHLPEPLYTIAYKCATLKDEMLANIADDPELVVGLRKLLEAKDCFVRAKLSQENKRKGVQEEGKPI